MHKGYDGPRYERFDRHRVTSDLPGSIFVDWLARHGQQHDRNVRQRGILLDERGNVVAVTLRHTGVGQHDVRRIRRDLIDCLLSVPDGVLSS